MLITYTFLGDSITCSDRFFLSDHDGLGDGYVYLLSRSEDFPNDAAFINKGYDGLTASALLERLLDGRIELAYSDVLCLLIGINDIGVAHNTGQRLSEENLHDMLSRLFGTLSSHAGQLICFSPFLFPYPEEYLTWMEDLKLFNRVLKDICTAGNIPFFHLQEYFQMLLSSCSVTELSPDGIHLTRKGVMLLADFVKNALT